MKKVEIINNKNGRKFRAEMEDPTSWISEQVNNDSWGKNIRWTPKKGQEDISISDYDDVDVLQEEERLQTEEHQKAIYELDGEGESILEEYTYLDIEGVERTGTRKKQAVDGEGELLFETIAAVYKTWVQLKPEYDIVIEDITEEYNAALQEKADRKAEIKQLKVAKNIINNWESMSDIKLPFLKKFFKRILADMKE